MNLSFFLFTLFIVFVHLQNTSFPPDFFYYSALGPVPLNVAVSPNLYSYLNVAYLNPYDLYNVIPFITSGVRGIKLWEYMTNNRPNNPGISVYNQQYGVNVTIINTGYESNNEIATVTQLLANGTWGNFDVIFPPITTAWTQVSCQILNNYDYLLISPWSFVRDTYECGTSEQYLSRPPCIEPSTRRYKNLWTVLSPNDLFWDSAFNLLKLKGASTVAIWTCNDPTYNAEAIGGLTSATRNNFDILNSNYIVSNISITPDTNKNPFYLSSTIATVSDYHILVRALLTLDADVILSGIIPTVQDCNSYFQAMKDLQLSPNACLAHNCVTIATVDARYIIDIFLWDPSLHGIDYADTIDWITNDNGISSVPLFDRVFYHYFNTLPDFYVVMAYAAGYAFELALQKAGTADPTKVPTYFSLIQETTIWGNMGFNGYGMNTQLQTLYIQQNSTTSNVVIYPLGASSGEIIYPFVDWNDRIFNPTFLGTTEEKIMFALFILEIVYTAICFGILCKNWDRRSIKASSPIFMTIMLVGSIFIYSTVPSWMIWVDIASCHLRIWFLNLGFTLLFGTLTSKTHRIKTLFLLKKMRPKKFSDKKLLILVAGLVAIDILLLILWSAITRPYVSKVVVVTGSGTNDGTLWENLNYLDCFYNTVAMTVFLSLAGSYKVVMVGYGLYLSLLLWKYGSSMWVESKQIIFAMYNLIIFSLIGLALQLSLTAQDEPTRKVLFVTRSMCMFLSATITITAILLPRLMDPEGKAHEGQDTTGTKKTVDTAVQLNDLEWKHEVLEKKYKELKKRHKETNPDDPLSEDK